jgi:hypothetical protein
MRVQLSANQNRTVQKRFMRRRIKLLDFQRQKQLDQRKSFTRIMTWKGLRGQKRCIFAREDQLGHRKSSVMKKDMVPQKNISGKVRS